MDISIKLKKHTKLTWIAHSLVLIPGLVFFIYGIVTGIQINWQFYDSGPILIIIYIIPLLVGLIGFLFQILAGLLSIGLVIVGGLIPLFSSVFDEKAHLHVGNYFYFSIYCLLMFGLTVGGILHILVDILDKKLDI